MYRNGKIVSSITKGKIASKFYRTYAGSDSGAR